MPKTIYTEIDIENLVKQGILLLEVNDDVVLTDLAYEKANRLGIKLIHQRPDNPPSAPVRPYVAGQPQAQPTTGGGSTSTSTAGLTVAPARTTSSGTPSVGTTTVGTTAVGSTDLSQRIHNAVITRLGNQVDPALLDAIIQRVLKSTGIQ